MRGLKAVRYLILVSAASILVLGALTACGHGNDGASGGGGSSGGGNDGGSAAGQSSVTGTISWPNRDPAANASVYFYNYDPGFNASGWYNGKYEVAAIAADGSYSLTGCPCKDLTAYLYVPATPGADPANGGQACFIIMGDDSGNYQGRQANPGDVINWQALNMPCSPTFYTSDQPTVQSEATTVLPSLNSGTWQDAETRSSGGGSGG